MLLPRRQPDKPAAAANKLCSIRTRIGVYTEFGIDPLLIVCGILFAYYLHAKEVINGDFYIVIEETTYEEDEIPDDLLSEPDGKGID